MLAAAGVLSQNVPALLHCTALQASMTGAWQQVKAEVVEVSASTSQHRQGCSFFEMLLITWQQLYVQIGTSCSKRITLVLFFGGGGWQYYLAGAKASSCYQGSTSVHPHPRYGRPMPS
jgi:hypothetical protein